MSNSDFSIKSIGYVESPFDEKFAIPRQSSLIHSGRFILHFYSPFNTKHAFEGIEEFSHLWVTFLFHEVPENKEFTPKVRPPRLGGNISKGVFATRSPFRPNRLGLSVVRLIKVIEEDNGTAALQIEGVDVVNGTPIIDIKPYIKFVDSIPEAVSGFAQLPPPQMSVCFSDKALHDIQETKIPCFKELILEVLAQDPRPAYKHKTDSENREYGVFLYGYNVKWVIKNNEAVVIAVAKPVI